MKDIEKIKLKEEKQAIFPTRVINNIAAESHIDLSKLQIALNPSKINSFKQREEELLLILKKQRSNKDNSIIKTLGR
jgi:hypothetical protein